MSATATKSVIYEEIDNFVKSQPAMEFEGWDVLVYRVNHAGWMRTDGVQIDGSWHIQKRISPNAEGKWVFDSRDVKNVNSG